jgi:hypothetical protein
MQRLNCYTRWKMIIRQKKKLIQWEAQEKKPFLQLCLRKVSHSSTSDGDRSELNIQQKIVHAKIVIFASFSSRDDFLHCVWKKLDIQIIFLCKYWLFDGNQDEIQHHLTTLLRTLY